MTDRLAEIEKKVKRVVKIRGHMGYHSGIYLGAISDLDYLSERVKKSEARLAAARSAIKMALDALYPVKPLDSEDKRYLNATIAALEAALDAQEQPASGDKGEG